jgi:hypothetical protein
VDESSNTTSYLMVLQSNGLLRYHTVEGTLGEDNLLSPGGRLSFGLTTQRS